MANPTNKVYINTLTSPQSELNIDCDELIFSIKKNTATIVGKGIVIYELNLQFVIHLEIISGFYFLTTTPDAYERIYDIRARFEKATRFTK